MKRTVILLLSLAFTAAVASGQAMDNKQMLRRLGLTDDQINQFSVIQQQAQPGNSRGAAGHARSQKAARPAAHGPES